MSAVLDTRCANRSMQRRLRAQRPRRRRTFFAHMFVRTHIDWWIGRGTR
jgi:hypothetical protein